MDFGTPILAALAYVALISFKILVIGIGLTGMRRRGHLRPTTAIKFFSSIELVTGLGWLFTDLLFISTASTATDELWVISSTAITLWVMVLSIGHWLELRRPIAAPTLIFLFGIVNLRILRYLWYLVTVYEATW